MPQPMVPGSSPLTRGKLGVGVGVDHVGGLIPAHAGKTAHGSEPSPPSAGSSPLTRGKRRSVPASPQPPRLIPAHAGKTYSAELYTLVTRAHPRSRGENRSIRRPRAGRMGSSPLTRGKRNASRALHIVAGLIPAHAGKTNKTCNKARVTAAHPRSRGENVV